jgi:Leucine-rich repeat (LRR) protein
MVDFPIPPANVSKSAPGTPGGVTAKTNPILTISGKKIKKSQLAALNKLASANRIKLQVVLNAVNSNDRGQVLQLRLDKNSNIKDISAVSGLPDLQVLKLYSTGVKTINALNKCTKLRELSLGNTQVMDLKPLRGLKNLAIVYLWKTRITDITPLGTLPNLREVYLNGNTSIANIYATLKLAKKLDKLNVTGTKPAVIKQAVRLQKEAGNENPPRTITLAVK